MYEMIDNGFIKKTKKKKIKQEEIKQKISSIIEMIR